MSLIEEAVLKINPLVKKHNLLNEKIEIIVDKSYDGTCLDGKEVRVDVSFLNKKTEVFTDEPSSFSGALKDILNLPLNTNKNRALVAGAINGVMKHLNMVDGSLCDRERFSSLCAEEMADRLYKRWGDNLTIALIGFQNDIAEALVDKFSKNNIEITDLDKDNLGKSVKGVEIKDGRQWTAKAVEKNFLALVSATTIINNTAEDILDLSKKDNKSRIVIFYGTSISGVASLLGYLRRLCLKSH